MSKILRSPIVERDLRAIWRYIARDHPGAADELLDRIDRTIELLADNPRLGRSRQIGSIDVRSFTIGRYIVFYQPIEDGIDVLRVLHGARDVGTVFRP